MTQDSKILITGSSGMVGTELRQELKRRGYSNIIGISKNDIDLCNQSATFNFFEKYKPDYVFHLAAKVGGILANIKYPADFLYQNIMINSNIIEAARLFKIKKLLYLGSSCIYPRLSPQPMKEEYLLTGLLEPTNEGYAIAKIVGIKLCEYYNKQYGCNFISAIPPNLFGPYDNFLDDNSHVIPALIRKIYSAKINNLKSLELWGTGNARREFLFIKDLVDGIIFLMLNYNDYKPINIGSGEDYSIAELVDILKDIIGYNGEILWDKTKPDGMPKKLLDSSRILKLGWKPRYNFKEALIITYEWFTKNISNQSIGEK